MPRNFPLSTFSYIQNALLECGPYPEAPQRRLLRISLAFFLAIFAKIVEGRCHLALQRTSLSFALTHGANRLTGNDHDDREDGSRHTVDPAHGGRATGSPMKAEAGGKQFAGKAGLARPARNASEALR